MVKKALSASLMTLIVLGLIATGSFAAEKLRFGSAVKLHPPYYLPILAAEDSGAWKEEDLEVEWIAFRTPADLMQAVAAGEVKVGTAGPSVVIPPAARGLPVIIIGSLVVRPEFFLWVKSDSPFQHPKDLNGKRIGVMRMGTAPHAYARVVAQAVGIEKDVRFVGTGDIPDTIAALETRAIEAMTMTRFQMVDLELAGKVRVIAALADYVPKEWVDQLYFAHKELVRTKPDTVKRVMRALVKGINFALNNPSWTIAKIKSMSGFSDKGARLLTRELELHLTRTAELSPKVMENIRKFLIEYDLSDKERTPPVQQLYTAEFVK